MGTVVVVPLEEVLHKSTPKKEPQKDPPRDDPKRTHQQGQGPNPSYEATTMNTINTLHVQSTYVLLGPT
jgi:hypothetical protein